MPYLNSSGALILGTATGTDSIDDVFGRGKNLHVYRGTTRYTSTGASSTFPAGTISMPADFYGYGPTAPYGGGNYAGVYANATDGFDYSKTSYLNCSFNTDGTVTFTIGGGSNPSWLTNPGTKNWYLPTTAGIGSSYYVRYTGTPTSTSASGIVNSTNITSSWLTLGSVRFLEIGGNTFRTGHTGYMSYSIQISADQSNVLYTGTVTIEVGPDI